MTDYIRCEECDGLGHGEAEDGMVLRCEWCGGEGSVATDAHIAIHLNSILWGKENEFLSQPVSVAPPAKRLLDDGGDPRPLGQQHRHAVRAA